MYTCGLQHSSMCVPVLQSPPDVRPDVNSPSSYFHIQLKAAKHCHGSRCTQIQSMLLSRGECALQHRGACICVYSCGTRDPSSCGCTQCPSLAAVRTSCTPVLNHKSLLSPSCAQWPEKASRCEQVLEHIRTPDELSCTGPLSSVGVHPDVCAWWPLLADFWQGGSTGASRCAHRCHPAVSPSPVPLPSHLFSSCPHTPSPLAAPTPSPAAALCFSSLVISATLTSPFSRQGDAAAGPCSGSN